MGGVMQAVAKKNTHRMEDWFFAVKLAWHQLSNYFTEVTPTTGMLLNCVHMLVPFRKLQLFRKWDLGVDIHREDEISYNTQSQGHV